MLTALGGLTTVEGLGMVMGRASFTAVRPGWLDAISARSSDSK